MVNETVLELLNPMAALFAGLVTSLHCMGMCGPLACALLGGKQDGTQSKYLGFSAYHLGKLVSYGMLGALAGGIGSQFVSRSTALTSHLLPWALAAFFLLIAMGLDRYAARLPFIGPSSRHLMKKAYSVKGGTRGLALGFATPFIPCGPLYLMVWIAALSGSTSQGAWMLLSFGLGTIPGLLGAQLGWSFLSLRMAPERLQRWRRNAALIACFLLLMRSFVDLSFANVIMGGAICH